ncbi:MAG: glycosyltransferase [Acidobacteria bacterium]|nr:glycosyltransferase [Acidobacteriota bacterium]
MNVLKILMSDYDMCGGAGIAMYRLHAALHQAGINSRILCGRKTLDSPSILEIPRNRLMRGIEQQLARLSLRLGLNDVHCVSSFGIPRLEVFKNCDLLHIHGLHTNFFSYLALPRLTQLKPTIFTLHDMWGLTAHCAYPFECDRWKSGCGKCPHLDTHPAVKRDATRLGWKLKSRVYRNSQMVLVAPTRWLISQVAQGLLARFPACWIPNGIETEIFKPLDRDECRALLGLPTTKRILLFATAQLKDQRKGGDLLLRALQMLPLRLLRETLLLRFGAKPQAAPTGLNMKTVDLGYLSYDRLKAMAYSAADVFVFPTRADNMPLVIQESLSCGTPVVSFRVGGVPEMVRHGQTGLLADPEDATGLAEQIQILLENRELREEMGAQGRMVAVQEYPMHLCVERHLQLYRQLVDDKSGTLSRSAVVV